MHACPLRHNIKNKQKLHLRHNHEGCLAARIHSMYACTSAHIRKYACVDIYPCIQICIYMYVYVYVYIYTHTPIYIYIYKHTHTYIYTHTHIHTHTHIYKYLPRRVQATVGSALVALSLLISAKFTTLTLNSHDQINFNPYHNIVHPLLMPAK
jgi:hypothetical protein